jgi:TetR/AcrR family transcriptional regulator
MNEKFFELPEEKQLRIINAGFEVFSKSDYKKASTEEIAGKAGISKGLLFYYFHDKRGLYLFLFDRAKDLLTEAVVDEEFIRITDVFELFELAGIRKYRMLIRNPHIMDFTIRAFFSQKEAVSEDMNEKLQNATVEIFSTYLSKMDYSKFRDDVNPIETVQMLIWLSDGYLHERQRRGQPVDMEDLMAKYRKWTDIFKKIAYKEEYLK